MPTLERVLLTGTNYYIVTDCINKKTKITDSETHVKILCSLNLLTAQVVMVSQKQCPIILSFADVDLADIVKHFYGKKFWCW